MPHMHSNRRPFAASAIVLALLLACLGLAACGGSSKSSSSTTATNAAATSTSTTGTTGTTSPSGKGPGANNSGRFAALRECLQKNGITLPKRTPGQRRPGGAPGGAGGFLGGGGGAAGPQLPKGVTRAQYEAALKKCGGNSFAGGTGRRFNSPTFKAALAKFATCMRENGVNIPAPNTSGSGPIFNTKGIDTAGTKFKTAETKCSGDLRAGFRGGAGAKGAPGSPGAAGANGAPGGAPPAGSAG
jgi:hypothetical protein